MHTHAHTCAHIGEPQEPPPNCVMETTIFIRPLSPRALCIKASCAFELLGSLATGLHQKCPVLNELKSNDGTPRYVFGLPLCGTLFVLTCQTEMMGLGLGRSVPVSRTSLSTVDQWMDHPRIARSHHRKVDEFSHHLPSA